MENERRAKKFMEEMEKADAAEKAQKAKATKLFDPAVVLSDAKRVHILVDEVLGEVRYGVLTKREIDELNDKEKEPDKRAYKMIFTMLKKGYPDLKLADVEDWPYEVVARISELMSKRFTSFLQPTPKRSPNG